VFLYVFILGRKIGKTMTLTKNAYIISATSYSSSLVHVLPWCHELIWGAHVNPLSKYIIDSSPFTRTPERLTAMSPIVVLAAAAADDTDDIWRRACYYADVGLPCQIARCLAA